MVNIDYDMIVFKEGDAFIAYCPELDISSCGDSVEHSREMLKTAVKLFIDEAERMGTLGEILMECNYSKDDSGKWIPSKILAAELVSI
ncbi:MAG: hypothetical protein HQK99_07595 [Nitrospirae bacterium]|nr:hypothetical protein [Nitrospirota bacterium]